MAIYYGRDPKNSVPACVCYWKGPGYYAGETIMTTYYLYCISQDKSNGDVSRMARLEGLDTPHWANTPEEAMSPYRIIGKKEGGKYVSLCSDG
jgi:hypothetical protein